MSKEPFCFRYQLKLEPIDFLDPYTLDENDLNYSLDGVPPVTNMDIVSYLLLTHSFYTQQQMKAYKSLEAYKYFSSGFVLKAGTKIVNNFYVLLGKVSYYVVPLYFIKMYCGSLLYLSYLFPIFILLFY